MRSPQPRSKRFNRSQKTGIALIFVAVMLFSGIGIAGFSALSHWNPNAGQGHSTLKPKGIMADAGVGSEEELSVYVEHDLRDYYAYGTVPASSYDVGQTIVFTIWTEYTDSEAFLYIGSSEVANTSSSSTAKTRRRPATVIPVAATRTAGIHTPKPVNDDPQM